VQTELTWPVGTDTHVPVKVNSQSTQTTSQQKTHPVLRLHQKATKLKTLVKAARGTLTPNRPLNLQGKVENQKPIAPSTMYILTTRSPCTQDIGCWMWRAGATRTPGSFRVLLLLCLFLSNGTCVVFRPIEGSSVY